MLLWQKRNPKRLAYLGHAWILRPRPARLEGSDLIIHAGDVGDPEILESLKL